MTVSAELFLPKSDLLVHESPLDRLTLKNLGREAIPTTHLALGQDTGQDLFIGERVHNDSRPTIHEETT